MISSEKHIELGLVLGYLASILLVPVYVQMYPVWRLVNETMPAHLLQVLPVLVTAALLLASLILYPMLKRRRNRKTRVWSVLAGAVLCLAALTLPDPNVPIKRIHVAEYLTLSLVVRFAMSHRIQGVALLIFSALFTGLLGIHDEFLQGFHPSRTYGLQDMAVNGTAAFGGALIWHGLDLFNRAIEGREQKIRAVKQEYAYLFWLLLTVLALIWPLAFYRGSPVPFWPVLPLVGSCVIFVMTAKHFVSPWNHGSSSISVIAFLLIVYPVVGGMSTLSFY